MPTSTRSILTALALTLAPAHSQLDQLGMLSEISERLGGANIDAKSIKFDKGNLVWDGGIHFKSDKMECFAERAEYQVDTEELLITGNVSIYKEGLLYRGERAVYNTKTEALDVSGMRSSLEPSAPLWFTAQSMETGLEDAKLIHAKDVDITTHDSSDPNFFLRAKDVKIYPEDRVVFKNVKAYVGDTPVFWLPYLSQPLNEEQGYTFTPGFRSNLGAFLLNQYGDTIGDHSLIKYKLDAYSSRGVALGMDLESRRFKDSEHFGKFKFYWINDANPQENGNFSTADRANIDPNRYRINLQHRIYLPGPEESDLYVDVDLNKLSDNFFYEDFFPWEFREDPQPDNFVNIVKRHDRGELSLIARVHANDFYASDSRLPELALDLVRQPFFGTGLFYNGTSSFGILKDHLGESDQAKLKERIDQLSDLIEGDAVDADGNEITLDQVAKGAALNEGDKFDFDKASDLLSQLRSIANEAKFNRFHTYHELAKPISVENSFTLTPRVGAGFTNYSSIGGPKPLNTSRTLLTAGLDASTKFSKVYDDMAGFGLDGMRHTIQPYVNWSFVSADDMGTEFRGIDRLVRSTQPRPIEPSNFTAIDSLSDWNLIRIGAANRFQTKRNKGTYTWLQTNTYFDTFIDDPEYDRDFSNLYTDVQWQPVNWTRLTVGMQLPLFGGEGSFTELSTRAAFMPSKSWEVSLGHRFLNDHPFFQDSNLVDLHNYWRINDNWGVSSYQRYELEDSTLELQQYSVHRDLSSWAMSLGAVVRDNRGETEYGAVFSLTLKEFPSVRIPLDFDPSGGGTRR